MDVDDEWELLSDESFLQITEDGGGEQIYSPAASVFHVNYFICPEFIETASPRLIPVPIDLPSPVESLTEADQDPVSQVFFKKMKEAEFFDMKVESPKPSAFVPQMEANFEIEGEGEAGLGLGEGGANVWKWSFGAICSVGVAAATFCIIVFTNNKKHPHHHNHKLRFRIYSDDKRMKAVAAVSGLRVTRARITVGGYYDGGNEVINVDG